MANEENETIQKDESLFKRAAGVGKVILFKNQGVVGITTILLQEMAQREREMMQMSLYDSSFNYKNLEQLIDLIISRKAIFTLGDEMLLDLRSQQEETGFNAWVRNWYPALQRFLALKTELREWYISYFPADRLPEWIRLPCEEDTEDERDMPKVAV
ncbi:MAG: hypothetical protein FJY91_02685 [Candidatus Harrisonbacteria bacterium]|nr:hypothetical protein [Candidatus Harrisonbacteria bacterium]